MELGEFPRDDDVLRRPEDGFDIGQRGENAVRSFVEDLIVPLGRPNHAAALLSLERGSALAFLRGQKSVEGEAQERPIASQAAPASPLAISALMAAFAPGTGKTGTPAAMAAAAIWPPGSAMPGVPASLTTAMRAPALSAAASSVARPASLCMW